MTLLWQVAPNGMACRADLEQVARETGRSPSRVTRIANILEHAGFLQWDWKESKYILDPLRKP
jgi:DNA-binding IclR family transcriptional regulator